MSQPSAAFQYQARWSCDSIKATLENFLSARLAASREVIAALTLASKKIFGFDRVEIEALILRLKECSDKENHFIARDAFNPETGEAYDAVGNFWSCGSKLCPTCIAVQSRRNRKKLREALQKQKLATGERYYFGTFTIKNPNASLLQTREIVDRSWQLFRKRKLCVDLIRGGSKSEEFTLTKNGYHYHLHTIFRSKFLLFNEVRRVWTECVEKAFEESGRTLTVDTADKKLFVKLIPINDLNGAIFEVCKYITKSDSWAKMRGEDLLEIALIRRWHRMFEMFGSFANRKEREQRNEDLEKNESIVHTRNLSDGFASPENEYWRDVIVRIGLEAYRDRLLSEIVRTREARAKQILLRWPTASIEIASEFLP